MAVTDNFNRANETPLASPWGSNTVDPEFKLVSNAAQPDNVFQDCSSRHTTAGLSADQYAQAKVSMTTGGDAGAGPGVTVRAASNAKTYYRLACQKTSPAVELSRFNAGTYTFLATRTVTWSDGDTFRVEVSGTGSTVTLKIFRNGSQLGADISDSDGNRITAAGSPGIAFSSGSVVTASVDDFEAGDLERGQGFNQQLLRPRQFAPGLAR